MWSCGAGPVWDQHSPGAWGGHGLVPLPFVFWSLGFLEVIVKSHTVCLTFPGVTFCKTPSITTAGTGCQVEAAF